jgi:hypothetical protein
MRSASCPNTQTPIIIPTTVAAVHSPDFVSEKPDHDPVVAEVLDRTQNHDAEARARGTAVRDEQAECVGLRLRCALHERFRLVQRVAHRPREHCRQHADQEHPAPADVHQQERRQQRGQQHTGLPAERDVARHACALARRPRFRRERHADPEFAAQPDARDGAVHEQILEALRERAQPGEDREQQDRPGQHAHPPVTVAQCTEQDAARHGADQRPRDQRAALPGRQLQRRRDRRQHEAEDQQVEAVHRIADRRSGQRFPRVRADLLHARGRRALERRRFHVCCHGVLPRLSGDILRPVPVPDGPADLPAAAVRARRHPLAGRRAGIRWQCTGGEYKRSGVGGEAGDVAVRPDTG